MKVTAVVPMMCLLTCVLLLGGCGGAKYDDVKKVSEDYSTAIDKYVADMDKAGNAGEVAKAVDGLTDAMTRLGPKMKELSKKYPELEKPDAAVPEELKAVKAKMDAAGQKIAGAMMKMAGYMNDPAVKSAMERMETAMKAFE